MENNQYCILWNNYHGSLVESIGMLQRECYLTDITLVCHDGSKVDAHQLILAACSVFLRNFIQANYSKHPVILLPTDIKFNELESLIQFMYTGKVCIQQDHLSLFIKGAKYLRIKGLDDTYDDSDVEGDSVVDEMRGKSSPLFKRKRLETIKQKSEATPMTTIKGKKVKDHRYTQQIELGQSDDNQEKWEEIDRKPVLLSSSNNNKAGSRKRRKKYTAFSKEPMHISNNVICYEQKHSGSEKSPINKVRKPQGNVRDEDLYLCSCTSRKIWSVNDIEALLKAWNETLDQVQPSYFIRSMSLCKSVARRLQLKGVEKNWRQCQVKMKNLRREVKMYKINNAVGGQPTSQKKTSEVNNACEKLMESIEQLFNKEDSIRREWYEKKGDKNSLESLNRSAELLDQVAILADSDICDDDDTDGGGVMETECSFPAGVEEGPHHRIITSDDGTVVHHIVENLHLDELHHHADKELVVKNEPEV